LGFQGRVVLVDDVITRGSTLFGCALRLCAEFPGIDVSGFAAARSVKPSQALQEHAIQAVVGTIRYQPGWMDRDP
jgi:adenine/guanine phosphoribosyltransferase-like PRPP-binding protein